MSELKVYHHELRHNEYEEFYLKYEADKVIAELKDKCQMHDFFWEGCGFAKRGFKNSISVSEAFDKLEAEVRHHKFKRCLAMARWCRIHDEFTQLESERLGLSQRALFIEYRRKAMWWNKWYKRWLELAEKFKKEN